LLLTNGSVGDCLREGQMTMGTGLVDKGQDLIYSGGGGDIYFGG